MKSKYDLPVGTKVGPLEVIAPLRMYRVGNARKYVLGVRCSRCGRESEARADALYKRKACIGCTTLIDNRSKDALYNIYTTMKQRCYSPTAKRYKDYGGRGIIICQEWLDDYQAFKRWAGENGYAKGLQIDRVNNDGSYSPDNCRWATVKANTSNTRNSRRWEHEGKYWTTRDLYENLGSKVNINTFRGRLDRGWSPGDAAL